MTENIQSSEDWYQGHIVLVHLILLQTFQRIISDAPLDVSKATIIKANILDSFSTSDFPEPDRNFSIVDQSKIAGGFVEKYTNTEAKVSFDLPYRWGVVKGGESERLDLIIEPTTTGT